MAAHLAEDVMILLVDPAALGGLAGLVVVASWALGRAHGPLPGDDLPRHGKRAGAERPLSEGAVPDTPPPTTIVSAPCQQRALEERRAALARPFVLAELHAEASAIRRDERILGDVPCEDALIVLTRTAPGTGCRFIGLSGQPTCPGATRLACPDSGACRAQGVHHPMHDPA
jgi:hypothetical protein